MAKHPVPYSVRRSLIDLHSRQERCQEEISLLKEEISRLFQHLANEHRTLLHLSENVSQPGQKALLLRKACNIENTFVSAKQAFVPHIVGPVDDLPNSVVDIVFSDNATNTVDMADECLLDEADMDLAVDDSSEEDFEENANSYG